MVYEAGLAKSLGNLFGLFVFSFKGVDQIQTNEIGHLDLHRHGAAVGSTGVTHAGLVAGPTLDAIDVDDANG